MTEDWAQLLNRPEIRFAPQVLEEPIRGRRILITGAAGSIGTALSEAVIARSPERVLLLDSHEASLFRLRQCLDGATDGRTSYVLADLRDRRKVNQVFRRERIDVVFHLAAYKHVPLAEDNVDQVASVNLLGTLNLVEAAREYGTGVFVYPSSDKAVTALSVYAATKRILEHLLRSMALQSDRPRLRIVRLVNVAGTQGSVVEIFARQAREGGPLSITDSRMDRYWMTLTEAIHLLLAASGRPTYEGLYMLDVGQPIAIAETARKVYRMLRSEGAEPSLQITGIRPGERLHEELKYPDERFRETSLPGLLAIEAPPPTFDIRTCLDELARFRECGYDWEPADVKAWLVRLASMPSSEEEAAPPSRAR